MASTLDLTPKVVCLPDRVSSDLAAIAEQTQPESVPDLPRLPVADTFIQFNRMGTHLDNALEAFKKVPESTGRGNTDAHLKDIVKLADAAIKIALRLMEANR